MKLLPTSSTTSSSSSLATAAVVCLSLSSSVTGFSSTATIRALHTPSVQSAIPSAFQLHSRKSSATLFMSSTTETTSPSSTTAQDELDYEQQQQQQLQQQALGAPMANASNKLMDNVVAVNSGVIAFVGLAVVYSLFHVHVEALLALWEYDLGPHGPDLTKMAVAVDVFARLPLDWIRSYESLVPTNPIFYKACTSGVAYTLGDFISQVYQGKTLRTLDLPRSFRSGAAGFIGHGPLCHYWLTFMETYLDFGGAWWGTGIKVIADLTVWAVFLNAAYSFLIGTLAGRHPKDVWADVKVTSWPALRSAWRFWPFVHTVSFSHAVPMDLKLLWVDVMEVVWVTILSKVANEDKNARMKANPELEVNANVASEVPEVPPPLEIELSREVELKGEKNAVLSFELPKKVLAACWPLIAMWPVLYGGYQLEKFIGLDV